MRSLLLLLLILSTQVLANTGVPMKKYSRGHWGVEVKINDQISYPFIIDTGAQGAIFPSALVKALGKDIDSLPEMMVQGAVGQQSLKRMTVDSISIGGQSVSDIAGIVLDLPFRADDYDNPGVLPYTFLNRFTPKFDLANNRLTLLPKTKKGETPVYSEQQFTAIPFELKSGSFISVELDINNQKVEATLDTGAGNRIDMNWLAASAMGVDKDNNNLSEGDSIHGAGGSILNTLALPDTAISIHKTPLQNRTVNIADVPVLKMLHGDKPAANFGLGILGPRQLIIDYENKQLLLSPEIES